METTTEKIDRYLDGLMNAEEKTAFENELNSSESLKRELEIQRNLRGGIERMGMKSTVNASFRKMTLKNKIYKWGVTTVAITAIGAAAYFGYQQYAQPSSEREITTELPALNEEGKAEWANADKNLPTQIFRINPDKDTVIETQEGIVFAIPAGAFLGAKNPVTLEIREALSAFDIIKGGLSTMNDSNQLETGGMFYLNARNGETSLKINPAKPVYVNLPTDEIRPGMMLFQGERTADGSINWKNPKRMEKQLVPVDIHSLNFYPKGFLPVVAELGFNANDKKVTDSIYYSYAGRKTWNETLFSSDSLRTESGELNIPDGEALFKGNCASCHNASEKKSTGPGLKGVLARIPSRQWAYDWVHDNNKLRASGDTYAQKILNEYGRAPMSTFPNLTNEEIDAILDYASSGNIAYEVDPAKISAIWNDKFQNTIIATKEFEERLQVIFKYGQPQILDLYVNNLNKKMYEIDSMAAALSGGELAMPEFHEFYLRHDGGIAISQSHMKALADFYNRKKEAVDLAAEKTFSERTEKEKAEDLRHQQMTNKNATDQASQYSSNFQKEFKINLAEAYRQLGINAVQPPPNAYYGFSVTNTGWNNVDRYVFESTLTRTTLDYTDPHSGKKAVIRYVPLTVKLMNATDFEQVSVYLVSDSLPCFMRINGGNGMYSEKLNELMSYSLVVVAQKDKQWFYYKNDKIKPGTIDVQTEAISEEQLRTNLDYGFTQSIGKDFSNEIDFMIETHEYTISKQARQKQEEIDRKIMKVIFPAFAESQIDASPPQSYSQ